MRNLRLASIFFGCLMVAPGFAKANLTQDNFLLRNTGDLVDMCSAGQSDPLYTAAVNFCQGFMVGVFRVLHEEDLARQSGRLFCLREPVPTRNQSIADFLQWVKANPGQMDRQPADSVASFLSQHFPCPRPGTSPRGAVQ